MLPALLMCLCADKNKKNNKKKLSLSIPGMCPACFSVFPPNISWWWGQEMDRMPLKPRAKENEAIHLSLDHKKKDGKLRGETQVCFPLFPIDGKSLISAVPPQPTFLPSSYPCGTHSGLRCLPPPWPAVNRWVAQSRPICQPWWCTPRNVKLCPVSLKYSDVFSHCDLFFLFFVLGKVKKKTFL